MTTLLPTAIQEVEIRATLDVLAAYHVRGIRRDQAKGYRDGLIVAFAIHWVMDAWHESINAATDALDRRGVAPAR